MPNAKIKNVLMIFIEVKIMEKINAIILILDTINEEIRKVKQAINTRHLKSNGKTYININRLEYLEKRKLINEQKLNGFQNSKIL